MAFKRTEEQHNSEQDKVANNLNFYRKKWLQHQSGEKIIKDKMYLKELQDIILYPDRHGLKV